MCMRVIDGDQGLLRFEDNLMAFLFSTSGAYEAAAGDGGALWNGETGKVVVKGDIMMVDSQNNVSVGVYRSGVPRAVAPRNVPSGHSRASRLWGTKARVESKRAARR